MHVKDAIGIAQNVTL